MWRNINGIYEDKTLSKKTYCLGIHIPGIVTRQTISKSLVGPLKYTNTIRDLGNIFFEMMLVVDLSNVPGKFEYTLPNQIIENINSYINPVILSHNVPIDNYIQFDPEDKLTQLEVIILDINGVEKSFLLGKSHNLYEDDNVKNNLVGKINHFYEDGRVDVYWTLNYSQNTNV